ncbi:MAG: pimeloyl-ACP methyl ester esterase BioH [Gammaproteobacteria bacterium]
MISTLESRAASPVFALHGWALNAAVFAPLLDWVGGHWLMTPDLPGHGRRHAEVLGRDPAALAARLLEEAPDEAVWLGWSLGGLVAQAAAFAAPERISALILVATTASFIERPGWPEGMPRDRLETMATDLERDPETTVNDFLTMQVHPSAAGRAALRGLRKALAERGQASDEALADGLALLETMDYRAQLARFDKPVLVIAGGRDRLVRPEAARALAAGFPDSSLVMIEQAGHAPFLSHPEECRTVLHNFLKTVDDGFG